MTRCVPATEGRVESLHRVAVKRGPPESVAEWTLVAGRGVPGDHHDRPGVRRAITLIAAESLDAVAERLEVAVVPGASRRNVTVRGLALDALPAGTRLRLGGAVLQVTGPCDPCPRMERAIGPGALAVLEGRGGLCARVESGGRVRVGDPVAVIAQDEATTVPPTGERDDALAQLLLPWFRAQARDLPWRRTRDPYAVWISEVMLQQTQVSTVIPYYERFLERFPTVASLAAAPLDDVLARWSGLGYYARARNLHRAAQAVVERHDGQLPAELMALRALPGFGPYTAGAVASIALGLDAPLVDGNVARVLCRIEGWPVAVEEALVRSWQRAPQLLPSGAAGDFNQALMELGATLCTPAAPACDRCPARSLCASARRGDPERYPLPKRRPQRRPMLLAAVAVVAAGRVLLQRRERKGLFGGLWELPCRSVEPAEPWPEVESALHDALMLPADGVLERRGEVRQALTHRDVTVRLFRVDLPSAATEPVGADERRWAAPDELSSLGLSSLVVKALLAAGVPVPGGHGRRRAVRPEQPSLF